MSVFAPLFSHFSIWPVVSSSDPSTLRYLSVWVVRGPDGSLSRLHLGKHNNLTLFCIVSTSRRTVDPWPWSCSPPRRRRHGPSQPLSSTALLSTTRCALLPSSFSGSGPGNGQDFRGRGRRRLLLGGLLLHRGPALLLRAVQTHAVRPVRDSPMAAVGASRCQRGRRRVGRSQGSPHTGHASPLHLTRLPSTNALLQRPITSPPLFVACLVPRGWWGLACPR